MNNEDNNDFEGAPDFTTIKQVWEVFYSDVLSTSSIPKEHFLACKMAFYAGASAGSILTTTEEDKHRLYEEFEGAADQFRVLFK